MTMESTPHLLLSVYQCGPGMGSVSRLGWEWYQRLAARVPVTLLTHVRNREALTAAGAPVAGSRIIYVDTEWFAGPLYRFASLLFRRSEHPVFLVSSLDFYVYDWVALRLARKAMVETPFDVVHQATPVSPLAATRLYKLSLPLVVGPWNGGLPSPEHFPEIMKSESGWLYSIRRIGSLINRINGTTRKARVILTATRATRNALPESCWPRCRFMLENAVDLSLFPQLPWPAPPTETRPLEVVYVGRLLPFKGISMLLEAIHRVRIHGPLRLTIVGTGALENELKSQARALGLDANVRFTGNLPLEAVGAEIAKAHVFCLPSVRESGGAVLLEAMAVGRPVIAVDYGGPAEIVDGAVGALLPATGRDDVIHALTKALIDAMRQPDLWRLKGEAGRRRVEEQFDWSAKIDAAMAIYHECLTTPGVPK
jgi:glycosyltransferase involved in cell wall biosynthesis